MKALRCLMSLHDWEKVSAEDGSSRYRRCRRCDKHDYPETPSSGDWAAGTFG